MTRTTTRPTLSLLVATLLLLAPSSRAGAAPSEAERHWQRGEALFGQSKYREAQAEFAQGYALSHKAGFLYNMAECARLLGDKTQARQLYLRYLTEHPQSKRQAEAKESCEALGLGPCVVPARGGASPVPGHVPAPVPVPAPSPSRVTPAPSSASAVPPYLPPPGGQPSRPAPPLYKRWQLWVAVGAVVVAGSVTAAVLATRSSTRPSPEGEYAIRFGQ